MHLYRPAAFPTIPTKYSERTERVVALVFQGCRRRAVEAARLRSPKARSILQPCELFARRLQSGLGKSLLQSRLARGRLAPFSEKLSAAPGNCLTGGATCLWCEIENELEQILEQDDRLPPEIML